MDGRSETVGEYVLCSPLSASAGHFLGSPSTFCALSWVVKGLGVLAQQNLRQVWLVLCVSWLCVHGARNTEALACPNSNLLPPLAFLLVL